MELFLWFLVILLVCGFGIFGLILAGMIIAARSQYEAYAEGENLDD